MPRPSLRPLSWPVAAFLFLAGCSDIPKDPEGTSDRIRAEGRFRVGLIAAPEQDPRGLAFIHRLSQVTRARPIIFDGAAEPLLTALEQGEVDLVVGPFDSQTPWATKVTILPAPGSWGDHKLLTAAAARNGENAWIMRLQAEADLLLENR